MPASQFTRRSPWGFEDVSSHSAREFKKALRLQMRGLVGVLSPRQKAFASAAAAALLDARTEWRRSSSILFFAPMADELDLWPLIQTVLDQGKQVSLPAYDSADGRYVCRRISDPKRDMTSGLHGIREPSPKCPLIAGKSLDMVLVPGVAFDLHGNRLGRGNGYYDRILSEVSGITCGAVFDQRVVAEVPVEPHDIRVNCILTPTRWIDCGAHGHKPSPE